MRNNEKVLNSWRISWTENGEMLARKAHNASVAVKPASENYSIISNLVSLNGLAQWFGRISSTFRQPVLAPRYARETTNRAR